MAPQVTALTWRTITIRRAYKINAMTVIVQVNDQHTMNLLLKKTTWDSAPWAVTASLLDHGPNAGYAALIFGIPRSMTNDEIKEMLKEMGIEVKYIGNHGKPNSGANSTRMVKVEPTSREMLRRLIKGRTDEEGSIHLGARSYNIDVFAHLNYGRCVHCSKRGHPPSQCVLTPVCVGCGSVDHKFKYRDDERAIRPPDWETNVCPHPRVCVNCDQPGHMASSKGCGSQKKWKTVLFNKRQAKRDAQRGNSAEGDEQPRSFSAPNMTSGRAPGQQSGETLENSERENSDSIRPTDSQGNLGTEQIAEEWPTPSSRGKTRSGNVTQAPPPAPPVAPRTNAWTRPARTVRNDGRQTETKGTSDPVVKNLVEVVNKQQKSIEKLENMLRLLISNLNPTGSSEILSQLNSTPDPEIPQAEGEVEEVEVGGDSTAAEMSAPETEDKEQTDAALGAHAGGRKVAEQRKSRSDKKGTAINNDDRGRSGSTRSKSSARNWSASGRKSGPANKRRQKLRASQQSSQPVTAASTHVSSTPDSQATPTQTEMTMATTTSEPSTTRPTPTIPPTRPVSEEHITPVECRESGLLDIQLSDLRHCMLYENPEFILIRKSDIDYLSAGNRPNWDLSQARSAEDNRRSRVSPLPEGELTKAKNKNGQ